MEYSDRTSSYAGIMLLLKALSMWLPGMAGKLCPVIYRKFLMQHARRDTQFIAGCDLAQMYITSMIVSKVNDDKGFISFESEEYRLGRDSCSAHSWAP